MLLYSMLHLTGVKQLDETGRPTDEPAVSLDDLRSFRQMGSRTPGHPEYVQFDGRPMPLAPEFTFNASYSHRFTFGNILVTPRFDVKYSTKYVTYNEWWWEVAGAEIWQPAYWKYSAYLNFGPEDGSWQLNAYLKNIDETVVRDISGGRGVSIQDPRTMGVGLTVRF